ncbi:hypothetical protein AB4Z18_04830 [Leifsonia sp. 2TAF2]|uniref:hypothetical protein n=1 Tax=Leifsonia sp. 2TAF2 TaxID=3233009 RepID=UPI003F981932
MREPPEPKHLGASDEEVVELCREWMRYLGATDAVVAAGDSRRVCDLYGSRYLGWVENKRGNLEVELVERAAAVVAADGRRGLVFARHGVSPFARVRADELAIAIFWFDVQGGTLDGVNMLGRDLLAKATTSPN